MENTNFPQWFIDADKGPSYTAEMVDGRVVWKGGVWKDGVWEGGVWEGGTWQFGHWKGGEWSGGAQALRSPWRVFLMSDGQIKIGCKVKTIQQWDEWFAGDEVYTYPRQSPQFLLIKKAYAAMKAYAKTK